MEHAQHNSEKGAWISIAAYLFLSTLKLTIGYLTNSQALIADGLNNTTDIIASVAVLIGLKIAKRPPDENHRYGHSKAETISSMIASFVMLTISVQVIISTLRALFSNEVESPNIIAGFIAIFGAIVMFFVYRYNMTLAKKTESLALKATAKDNLSDALVSIGAAIGIFGSQFQLPWLDPVTGLIVGLIIAKTGFDIFKESSYMLTDGFDENKIESYKHCIEQIPGVLAVRDIKARVYGNKIYLDVVIFVDAQLSVAKSHQITDAIEREMLAKYKVPHVHIHTEPFDK